MARGKTTRCELWCAVYFSSFWPLGCTRMKDGSKPRTRTRAEATRTHTCVRAAAASAAVDARTSSSSLVCVSRSFMSTVSRVPRVLLVSLAVSVRPLVLVVGGCEI